MEAPASSSPPVITPEDVLETLMNDGTIDAVRMKIISQLKANDDLKTTTIKMVEQSKVLNTPGADKQTKRDLFNALRQELEPSALEKASKMVWDLILDNNGFGKEISETVEKVFCRLSGKEPPLFPSSETQPETQPGKGKEKEIVETIREERENEKCNSDSSSKKRKLPETSTELGSTDAVASGSANTTSPLSDSGKMLPPRIKS
ncbi:hypothetical protein LIER_26774 [Lithospermum erythrorhizon]|uniref:Uncharacterized protein n=1 Tax=Lithospermum erythrorhizon TaxID=34254 RepID=A0AAV3R9K2_LITER